MRTILWLAMVLAGMIGGTTALTDDLEDDHSLLTDFETPHTDWAQPYALGKVRVLYFTSIPFAGTDYCKSRQMVELMQRFDIEATAVYWAQIADSPNYEWLGGEAGKRRIQGLLDQPFDCYFFDRLPVTNLTLELQYKLIKAVTEGAGLVLVGAEDERVLKPERRLQNLPPFLAAAQPEGAFTIAKGRGVKMGPHPATPYRVGWQVGYDYWQERLGRAVLWAANRVPEVDLALSADPMELDRAVLPREAVTVRWRKTERPRSLTLRAQLRSDDGQVLVSLPERRADAADGTLKYEVPLLPAAAYHVDIRAQSDRGIEAWATATFTITSSRRVESIDLARDWGEIGELINGQVKLSGEPLKGERLQVRLVDPRGRILMQNEWTLGRQPVSFGFPIRPWLPMLVRVEAVIAQGNTVVASDYRFLRLVKRHHGQFNFLAWEAPDGPLNDYVEEALQRLGVSVQLIWRNPSLEPAAHEIAWVPYSTRILAPLDANGIMQPACWNDDPNINKHVQDVVKAFTPSRQHGVFVYSLGDETVTRGSCLHPACLAAFRRYLKEQYSEIGALNAEWGSSYASFDEVELFEPKDNEGHAALRAKNYPRWYDRQAFQCYNFVQLCRRFGDAFRAIDPEARTGFEGAGAFNEGDDYDLIVRTNGFWSPYPGCGDEVIRSIAPRGFPHSNWMGYTKDANSLLAVYWRMILRGCDSVWWWMFPNMGRFNGLLRPTLEPYPAVREIVKDTAVVREGLGTVLINSEMQDDGIAILYSMPSSYAVRVESGPTYGSYEGHHVAWHKAIRELGLQFRYVTDRMLRLGEFDPKRFKVLILSRAEAIGREEAKVIRQFAEGGGTVLADLRPGLYDGHCKPLEAGLLDDLFGIRRTSKVEAAIGAATIDGELGGQPCALQFAGATCDPGVELTEGRALGKAGESPLFIVHRVGRGQAVLLNFGIPSAPSASEGGESGRGSDMADCLGALFTSAQIVPAVTLKATDGGRLRNVEAVRWRNGDIELLALFRGAGEAEEAHVTLPAARHIYDLRQRRYIGKTATFATQLIPSRATFLALVPEPVGQPKVSVSQTIRRGQQATVRVSVRGGKGLHAVCIKAQTPEGRDADWLKQVVMVGPRGADVALPFAFNDPPGKWTVRAIDVYTNDGPTSTVNLR